MMGCQWYQGGDDLCYGTITQAANLRLSDLKQ